MTIVFFLFLVFIADKELSRRRYNRMIGRKELEVEREIKKRG